MKLTKYPIYLWALIDLITIGYIVSEWVSERAIPFQNEILYIFSSANDPSQPLGGFIALSLLLLEISVFFSAYYLIRQKKEALYICYAQAPLRLFMSFSSISFLNSSAFQHESSMLIIDTIEYLKLITLFAWHIYYINNSNIKESLPKLKEWLVKFRTLIFLYVAFEIWAIFINYLNLYLVRGYHFINIFSFGTILAILISISYIFLRENVSFKHVISSILVITFLIRTFIFITNSPVDGIQTNILFMVINLYFVTAGSFIAFTTYKNKQKIT
jgi:hypothetical protein